MKNIPSLAISFFIGVVILLNQFGAYVSQLIHIPFIDTLWKVNQIAYFFDGANVFAISIILLILHFLAIRDTVRSTSFLQGLLSGFLALPLIALALGLAAGILWVLFWVFFWVFKIIFIILSFVAIPFVWLWENALLPVIKFIGIPFVWLWENVLLPAIKFIGVPFVWLWENLLSPVVLFLFSYVIKPLGILVLAVAAGLFILLPFIVVGYVFLKSFNDAFAKNHTPEKIFGYGVGLGFFLFEMVCNYVLYYYGISKIHPSLTALLPIALGTSFLIYYVFGSKEQYPTPLTFEQNFSKYWKESKLELAVSVCLIPISLVLLIFFAPSDEN